jgi:Tfp pilus assembly protein PilV
MASLSEALRKGRGYRGFRRFLAKGLRSLFRWIRVTRAPAHLLSTAEEGFVLIEVLISALIIVIAGTAVLTVLQATARSAGDQRHHSEAFAVAQEDQARLRGMRIPSLNRLKQITPVTLDGTKFEVESTGVFVNNTSGTASCAAGTSSADYVRITSSVTWPQMGTRPAVVMQSIVSPSNGSLDAGHGTLTISAVNAAQQPLPGVGISGTGPATFSGTTDAGGCANFADLPAGNYTLTPSAPGLIDKTGNAPAPQTVGVIASGTQTVALEYDRPGYLEAEFKYRVGSSTEFKASSANSIAIFNSNMTAPVFVSPGSSPLAAIKSGLLYPATSPYAVYAGTCTNNNPNPNSETNAPGAPAVAGITVPSGATVAPLPKGTIQLPALNLVVKKNGAALVGAEVKITGTCSFSRKYTTVTGGVLADPGLPWGTYEVCAATTSAPIVHKSVNSVSVQNLTAGTSKEIDLGSGTTNGTC